MTTRFDWVLGGLSIGPDHRLDVDLARHPEAAVVPTLGSLVPGWILLVPRTPACSFAKLSPTERTTILSLANELEEQLSAFGEFTMLFEHGASAPGSIVGCGTDQAHLHLVPTPRDLTKSILADNTVKWREIDGSDPWIQSGSTDYYLFRGTDGTFIGIPDRKESQYFRRHVAQSLGLASQWDYREHPFYGNAATTINHFSHSRRSNAA